MTRDEVLALKGRRLEKAVSEHIFRMERLTMHTVSDIETAWVLVNTMRERGFRFVLRETLRGDWCAAFFDKKYRTAMSTHHNELVAISRAALLAALDLWEGR